MKPQFIALLRERHRKNRRTTFLCIVVILLSFFPVYYFPELFHPYLHQFVSNPNLSSSFSRFTSPPIPPLPPPPPPPPIQSLPLPLPKEVPTIRSRPPPPSPPAAPSSKNTITNRREEKVQLMSPSKDACDVTRGDWVEDEESPYYTNDTCSMIQEHQNCLKHGRPDKGFMRWRWRPDGCNLRRFDATAFLEMMRGKTMAFVGDSLARNHMQSLLCLLSKVEGEPKDLRTWNENVKRVYYRSHEFTVWIFWSPFLVKAEDPEGGRGVWKVHLDRVDDTWTSRLRRFDYLIISAGNWYTRPSMYYQKRRPMGCNYCSTSKRIKRVSMVQANRKAFHAAFRAVNTCSGYRGVTFLRSLSPSHFEEGRWNDGGDCRRKKPFKRHEARMSEEERKLYRDQSRELAEAAEVGRRRGLRFAMLDTTEAMVLRPDGHPSRYGHSPEVNVTMYNDCVHWCLPGPIDMWNDLLFHVLSK